MLMVKFCQMVPLCEIVTNPGVNRHIQYTLALMCAKNHVNIFGSFLDVRQKAEWPHFLAHLVYVLLYMHLFTGKML